VRRFLGFVLLPAVLTSVLVTQRAQQARDGRRDAYLSRVGGLLATATLEDLATAWELLLEEAGVVAEADTTLTGVRLALSGDTVRSIGPNTAGPRVSVLFTRRDTLRSATAIFRSPMMQALRDVPAIDAAVYLRGVRLLPAEAEGSALPDRLAPIPGWNAAEEAWITFAGGDEGAGALALAVKGTGRRRRVASLRTLAANVAAATFALVLAATGFAGRPGASAGGRVTLALVVVVGATGILAGGVAVAEARLADSDGVRELTTVAELTRVRGLLDDPVAAQRWLGTRVIRIEYGETRTGDGGSAPTFALDLPDPPPGRPVTGSDADLIWLVAASGSGRTLFLMPAAHRPPLFALAGLGTLAMLAGALVVASRPSVKEFVRP
jgi:hypothetical protein